MAAKQFEDALKKGTGRAVLMLRDAPDDEALQEALMAACTKRLGYDLQSEESHSPWLHDMIRMTRREERFFNALLARLDSFDAASSAYDVQQVYELLCLLSAENPKRDRNALRIALTQPVVASEVWAECSAHFIRLVGLTGFVACVELFEEQLREDFVDWGGARLDEWIDALKARDGSDATMLALDRLRAERPLIDEMLALDAARELPQPFTPTSLDYTTLKANISSRPHFPRYWIDQATQAEIDQAAADFLGVTDTKIICAYLMMFARRSWPLSPNSLLRFLDSDDRREQFLAAKALGLLSDARIRARAFDFLTEGNIERTLQLLPANYREGDLTRIDAVLQTLDKEDDLWHGVGSALLALLDLSHDSASESVNSLIMLYENGPCSICRTQVVSKLRDAGRIPDWMARECLFDSDSDTRDLFSGIAKNFGGSEGPPK